MLEPPTIGLRVVTADDLEPRIREVLRPGGAVTDRAGISRRLPSYYYEVPSWEAALETRLAPNFGLWEFIDIDVREHRDMRIYPRYVPCAITLLAAHLQVLRAELGREMRVAANGGYRSPAHRYSSPVTPHCWATGANIYRIGSDYLDSAERIETVIEVARRVLPGAWVRPYGDVPGYAFDHLHIDLGFVELEPNVRSPSKEGGDPGAGEGQ